MPKLLANTTAWEDNTKWTTMQAFEGGWCWYISINDNMLFFIVDYYSKFHIMKKADSLSADDIIRAAKIVFTEFGLQKK